MEKTIGKRKDAGDVIMRSNYDNKGADGHGFPGRKMASLIMHGKPQKVFSHYSKATGAPLYQLRHVW